MNEYFLHGFGEWRNSTFFCKIYHTYGQCPIRKLKWEAKPDGAERFSFGVNELADVLLDARRPAAPMI